VKLNLSEVIDRPPDVVFQFIAVEHVQNHPRWDPKMELEQVSDGPLGVGTIVRRRHTHAGSLTEGTMECVEFDPPRALGWLIRDGALEMHARTTFEPQGLDGTRLTGYVDIPGMTNPLDPLPIRESMRRMKELIEAER
jgi:hypothetical protein